jgi:AIPR protein
MGGEVSQFHVSQIETHIRNRYADEYWDQTIDDVNNLSRLLALHSVNLVLGDADDDSQRIVEITDGSRDRGIDAVGIDQTTNLIVLVQSKWRRDGTGSLSLAEVLKFLDGVRSLLGMKSDEQPFHALEQTRAVVRTLLTTPGARIRLVTATTGSDPLADEVERPILDLMAQLNDLEGTEPLATHVHLGQASFFNSLTKVTRPAVNLEIQMQDWGRASEPLRVFYGRVSAAEIAGWFDRHGADLFAENIRVVIPRSEINQGILDTIRDEPDRFGYYNNGITVLAASVELGPAGALHREVGYFKLTDASVVNGAQTVSTLGRVLGSTFEPNLGVAFVLVRVIEVPQGEGDLARRITRFANTQNEVSSQDFAFLDEQQHRLVRELRVLGYDYILRSGEVSRSSDRAKVIDVRDAAVALACASSNLSYAVTAKREVSRLFSDLSIYSALFNPVTEPLRLLRSTQISLAVDRVLDEVQQSTDGIEAGVAVHGRRVISHIILRQIGDNNLKDPDSNIDVLLMAIPEQVRSTLNKLVGGFPNNSYPGNVFKNQRRCAELVASVGLV